jgi:hypothetical protein
MRLCTILNRVDGYSSCIHPAQTIALSSKAAKDEKLLYGSLVPFPRKNFFNYLPSRFAVVGSCPERGSPELVKLPKLLA